MDHSSSLASCVAGTKETNETNKLGIEGQLRQLAQHPLRGDPSFSAHTAFRSAIALAFPSKRTHGRRTREPLVRALAPSGFGGECTRMMIIHLTQK
jgi:hypothetical protein